MSTFTASKFLELVARGGDLGTWDTPTNSNWSIVDAALGQIATIGLNNSNVALSAAQFQCNQIIFNSTLTGSVSITFPTTFYGPYHISNLCTGTSAFTITLQTTSGGQVIGCPPGAGFDIFNDGSNLYFTNLWGPVGSYMDYAGSSLPNWMGVCTVSPFLNCNGGTFSSATYPILATILGSTTLPDSLGRVRMVLDQSAGRVSSAVAGFSPNTVGSAGGDQRLQTHGHTFASSAQTFNTNQNTAVNPTNQTVATAGSGIFVPQWGGSGGALTTTINLVGTISNSTQGGSGANMQPTFVGGLTLIRSA